MPPVTLEEIKDSAIRIAIRLALGDYVLRGPRGNIMELESRVAWSTVVSELQNEGYTMVSPEEYGAAYRMSSAEVSGKIEREGNLFALLYPSSGGFFMAVPLEGKEEKENLGPVPL